MSLVMTSGPTLEPVTLTEAKAHLRVEHELEDSLIHSLIMTSRLHIEAALGLALLTQRWSYFVDRWPRPQCIDLPIRPVQSIAEVKLWSRDGTSQTAPASAFTLDGQGLPARLAWQGVAPVVDPTRAINGVEIDFVAGFGTAAANVPAPIRQALLLLLAHWYENREPLEIGSAFNGIPPMVSELLMPYRRRRV